MKRTGLRAQTCCAAGGSSGAHTDPTKTGFSRIAGMKKLFFWRGTALALFLLGALGLAHAVDVNARISGTVTDPQGAVLPNIQVTLTNEASGVKQVTTTLANGSYLFAQVPVGSYTISVSASGFKAYNAKGIVVTIDQEYVEPIQLQVGSTTEVINVEASSVQVNTTDMQLDNVVNSEQIVELPLINRAFTGLELTLPGVQASSDRFGTFSVSGGQTQQSEYLINGADTNDIALNTVALNPNLDAIDQFNLIDGPLNAEYDRNSGGIVSATIKSGNNHFHGDAFEFYRDTFLNTLTFFQKNFDSTTGKYDGVVSPYHQNIYGGTVGGPILHDKLFFFGAYQGTKQRTPDGSGQVDVFSTANRTGDFSVEDNPATVGARPTGGGGWGNWQGNLIPTSVSIPGCTAANETWAQCAYDLGGKIPSSAFNSVAANLMSKYVPLPSSGQTYLYNFDPVTTNTANQYIGRIDSSINPANQITFLGIYSKSVTTDTLPFTGASLPGFGDMSTLIIQQYTFDYVRQFSASLVNDLALHYTRFNYDAVEPQNKVDPASLGFAIHPENTAGEGVPTISVGGNASGFTLGFSTNGPQPRIDQVAQIDETISKVVGNHTFKFGYDGRRFNVHNPFSAVNNGSFGFGGASFGSGDGSVDFLMGVPNSYSQNSGAEIIAEAFLNYGFAQDTWKMTPSFTLSYGLGYSIDTPLHNQQYGGEAVVCIIPGENTKIFPGAPTSWVYPGDPGCNNAGQATTLYSEFGPRVGFAWAPDLGALSGGPGKLSVRGGFGIYYDRTEEESSLQTLATPPFGTGTSGATTPQFANPFADINNIAANAVQDPFPYTFPAKGANIDWGAQEAATGFNALFDVSTYGPDFRAPYAENFQLSIEREFPSRVVARASYVGSLARHNQTTTDANPITPAGHAACAADTTYCANPTYTGGARIYRIYQSYFFPQQTLLNNPAILDVGLVGSGASSSYHSLQASVEKATTHGLTFQLSYTYAHAMDTGSSFENAGFGESARGYNQFDPALNYGDSAYDVRQRLVFSPIYITPMHSGAWYSPMNLATSGWMISGITTLATGFPYDVSYSGGGNNDSLWCPDGTNFYACPDVPEQVAGIKVTGNPRVRGTGAFSARGAYIDKTDFANEPIGEFGNVHRNPAHGPGLNNTNLVVAKNIYFSEDRQRYIQLRMESDNVFNHTQFTNPSSNWSDTTLTNGNSGFGYITGTQAGRLSQLAAKIYF